MTRFAFLRLVRPVHAVLLCLGILVVVIPLLSALGESGKTVEATKTYISAERPIDRILAGQALGSRRILNTPPPALDPVTMGNAPRLVQPPRLRAIRADAAPDLTAAILAVAGPLALPPQVQTAEPDELHGPVPRRKPARPTRPVTVDGITLLADQEVRIATRGPAGNPAILTQALPLLSTQPASNAPRIAFVMTAAGLNEATTRTAIDILPREVTLAFAPIGERAGSLARDAMDDGHTVLVEIPMEPVNPRRDPGEPFTLRTSQTAEENTSRLEKALAPFPLAAGVSNYLGARFSRSEDAVSPILLRLATRGLLLFENQPSAQSRLKSIAKSYNVPYTAGRIVIDSDRSEEMMRTRLSQLEQQARQESIAIGVLTAYRSSIMTLAQWMEEAQHRGIAFVPVTQLAEAN